MSIFHTTRSFGFFHLANRLKYYTTVYDDKSDPDDGQDAHEDKVDDNGDLQVEEALALGANPNMRGHDGSTALMQVVSSSYIIILCR